jgi:hypothetical protein
MRKISILFLLTLILGAVLVSCTVEDKGTVDMSLIAGKWNFSNSTATSGSITIPCTTTYISNEVSCDKDYVEIITGGVVKYGNYTSGCVLEEKEGTWTQTGNSIDISVPGSGFIGTFNVANLTATELKLKIDGSYEGNTGTFNMYFTK